MVTPDLISVIVTTYNRSDAVAAVLKGLSAQSDRHFEVVIADDGSETIHRENIRGMPEFSALRASYVWHPDEGFTAAKVRNLGVAASAGDYIVFLDGDCVPEVDFIAQHRRLAEPGCFINGSRVLLSEKLSQQVTGQGLTVYGQPKRFWWHSWQSGDASRIVGTLRLPDGGYRHKRHFSWKGIRSCNLALWRSDFLLVDGFDEIYVGWGHEDADLVLRLHHAGVVRKNGFCATEVFHLWHRESSRDRETANANRVRQRAQSQIVKSEIGYSQSHQRDRVVVTRLR